MANSLLLMAWRLGLGWLVGRYVLLLTTVGRESGKLHRVPVSFLFRGGTFYVRSTTGKHADWYRNLEARPVCTTQTWPGPKAARARPITAPEEAAEVAARFDRERPRFGCCAPSSEESMWVALEPTAQNAPGMLEPDLIWAWPVAAALGLVWSRRRRARS